MPQVSAPCEALPCAVARVERRWHTSRSAGFRRLETRTNRARKNPEAAERAAPGNKLAPREHGVALMAHSENLKAPFR